MSTEVLAAMIGSAVTLFGIQCTLLGWILLKLNTISTLMAVSQRRLEDGDKRLDDLETRMRTQEQKP